MKICFGLGAKLLEDRPRICDSAIPAKNSCRKMHMLGAPTVLGISCAYGRWCDATGGELIVLRCQPSQNVGLLCIAIGVTDSATS